MKSKQLRCKALFAVLTLTLLLSFTPVCYAADNATNFNTICDWLEINLPDYFSPKAETFETSGFFIRYYQNTNTYVGTINGDFYVLGGAFGNEVVYVGTMEYLLSLISPPDAISFAKLFSNKDYDIAKSVQQTDDGGYIIAGYTWANGAGENADVYLLKTDSSGNKTWAKTFGGTDWDNGLSVQQTDDGGYIIAGDTKSYGAGDYDIYLIKTDNSGNETWSKTFGGTNYDKGRSVQQTDDGGYIIAGSTKSSGAGGFDVYLIKTDSNGNETWSKTFGGADDDEGRSVQQTTDGGYIIAGFTYSSGAGENDVYLIKTDSNGNESWAKAFGGTDNDEGESIQQTTDGGYIITGYTKSSGAGNKDVYLLKTDSSGNESWAKTFGGTDRDEGESIQQTTDGGYIITGTKSSGAEENDVYLLKTDSSGNESWAKTFGGVDLETGYSVQQTTDGGYIIAGELWINGVSSNGFSSKCDIYLIKTDGNGNL